MSFPYGSAHASELNYLFKLRPSIPDPVPLTDIQRQLSQTMIRYWAQFARSADPNSGGTPAWPAYQTATDQRLSLSTPSPYLQSTFAVDHHCQFWAPGT